MAVFGGKVQDEAFVTLATNDVYAKGALVLAESLKMHGTTRHLVVMTTPHVSPPVRTALSDVFDTVQVVDVLDSKDEAHLTLMKRPELGVTFTKLHCWTLTQFKKCVFMDADMLVLQNIDDLFEREELSAARDSGWPDIFNSGLFVYRPSIDTYKQILALADAEGSFDGGDQGLLNSFFSDWSTCDISRHIPFLYNLHITTSYTYLPAFKKFGKDTKVVHFLGSIKPWHHIYDKSTGGLKQISSEQGASQYPDFLRKWWAIYDEKCWKYFTKEQETGISSSPAKDSFNDENCAVCKKLMEHSQNSNNMERGMETPFNWELPCTFFKTSPHYGTETYSPNVTSQDDGNREVGLVTPSSGHSNNELPMIESPAAADDTQTEDRIIQTLLQVESMGDKMPESSSVNDTTFTQPIVSIEQEGPSSPEGKLRAKWEHKSRWESGNIDYVGEDKFENIQALLDTYL